MKLRDTVALLPKSTLAERLEYARMVLKIHGFLRPAESARIKTKIHAQWDEEAEPADDARQDRALRAGGMR
jgi:hypothetical protein